MSGLVHVRRGSGGEGRGLHVQMEAFHPHARADVREQKCTHEWRLIQPYVYMEDCERETYTYERLSVQPSMKVTDS